jgi:protein-L-isoaspartate(D-aspartate) O-methyltransferase
MSTTPDLDQQRGDLVAQIAERHPLPPRISDAMRAVPRHVFLPGLDPSLAYRDQAVTLKPNPNGPLALSCASVPSMVALMLTQLDPQPGDRILEIGAGTGYNAALLAELVGPTGHVTTVDIDPGVALHARDCLDHAGYEGVTVMERDGTVGAQENAPYDRIIATVGMWDLPRSWWRQLTPNGRVVMPLRWRGQTRTVALDRVSGPTLGDRFVVRSSELCGFIPFVGQDGERTTALADDTVRLHHDVDQPIDSRELADVLGSGPDEIWTDVRVGYGEPFDGIWLQAAASDNRVCRIEVTTRGLATGIRAPIIPIRSPALVDRNSIAYLIADPTNTRLGVAGYGPAAAGLANDLASHVTTWSTDRAAIPALTLMRSRPGAGGHEFAHQIHKVDTLVAFS